MKVSEIYENEHEACLSYKYRVLFIEYVEFQSSLTPPDDPDSLEKGIDNVKNAILCVLKKIRAFKILSEELVPEGLKPIARSISWLVEQIVVQNLRSKGEECNINSIKDPPHGLTQYDCILNLNNDPRAYKINVKTSLTITDDTGRFDISKAHKLIQLYETEPNLVLLVAIVKVEIDGVTVKFKDLIVFNVAWISDIYYNRANHNLQSSSTGTIIHRTNEEFIKELKQQMERAGHLKHY